MGDWFMNKRKWTSEEIRQFRSKNNKILYFNKEDANIFVPKLSGGGWTLNFSNRLSYLVLTGIVVLFSVLLWYLITYCS
jgi:uncharacterized membrane protein